MYSLQHMGEDPDIVEIPNCIVQKYLAERTLKLWQNEGFLISSNYASHLLR